MLAVSDGAVSQRPIVREPDVAWALVAEHADLAGKAGWKLWARADPEDRIASPPIDADELWPYAIESMFRAASRYRDVNRSLLASAAYRGAMDGLREMTRVAYSRRNGRRYQMFPAPMEEILRKWDCEDLAAASAFEHLGNEAILAALPGEVVGEALERYYDPPGKLPALL